MATRRARPSDVACALVAIGGVGLSALDGSVAWCLVRLAVIVGACVAVAVICRAWRPRRAALVLVGVGTIAAAAGGTIAWSHLGTTGVSPKAIGGLLALAGGVGALTIGTSGLLRAAHGWRPCLAIPIAAAVVYVVVLPVTIAVYATNVPRPSVGSTTPADLGFDFVDATFTASDGVELSGWYIPSTNGGAVVLLHGASSTRSNVLDRAAAIAAHGYGVLLYDARGHGRSGGRAMELGWYGDRDVSAAVDFLEHRPDVDPRRIGAIGMSMGGEQVIGAMGADPRIAAGIAEGATNRVFGDKAWLAHQYGVRGWVQRGPDWISYRLADLLTAARPPITLRSAVVAAAPRRLLLIAAGTRADEQHAGEWIRAASPDTVELWVVPGAGHTGGLRTSPAAWTARVVGFLDANLPANT
ncbi:MAG: alpha/beta fold hydrolase [Actinobacteria bacterium]|nr:alpha/beta fold hydrolase [Actinomycetota bacterium]